MRRGGSGHSCTSSSARSISSCVRPSAVPRARSARWATSIRWTFSAQGRSRNSRPSSCSTTTPARTAVAVRISVPPGAAGSRSRRASSCRTRRPTWCHARRCCSRKAWTRRRRSLPTIWSTVLSLLKCSGPALRAERAWRPAPRSSSTSTPSWICVATSRWRRRTCRRQRWPH